MKKSTATLLIGLFCLAACKKSSDSSGSGSTSSTFTANVNGKATTFNVSSATLLRSQPDNEKRLDITGVSADKTKRLIITLGIETYMGSGMTVKSYVLNPFPEDDPNTPDVDESATTQGFTTYSTSLGGSSWLTDVYNEQGLFTVSSCDSAHTTISGTFQTTLKDISEDTTVLSVTEGKIANLKYSVLN